MVIPPRLWQLKKIDTVLELLAHLKESFRMKIALAISVLLNLFLIARSYQLWTQLGASHHKLTLCQEKSNKN